MSTNVIVGLPGGPLGPSLASLRGSVPCRLGLILGLSTAEAPYVQGVIARASPGLARLLWTLPLILLHTVAPLTLDCREAILEKVVVMFLLTWLANFKLLAFCLNRGPLVGPWSTAQMAAILCQPLYPVPHQDTAKKDDDHLSGRLRDHAGESHALLKRWIAKTVVFIVVVAVLFNTKPSPLFRDMLQVIGLYCFVGFLMDGSGSVLTHALGFNIIPTFDQPWLSSSMADFWGRRWNIPTSHLLRCLVYDPIVQGCWVKDPTKARKPQSQTLRAIGTCCTFLVSGIAHEVILYACQPDGKVSWKWLIFFTIQGPLMLAENSIVRWGQKRGLLLNIWVARAMAVGFMMTLGHLLFFAACNSDTDTAQRVISSCQAYFQPVTDALSRLL